MNNKITKKKNAFYSLKPVINYKLIDIPDLCYKTLLEIDELTTSFNTEFSLFDHIKNLYKLNLTDSPKNPVKFVIIDERTKKKVEKKNLKLNDNEKITRIPETRVFFKKDKNILNRSLIGKKIATYINDPSFRNVYLKKYSQIKMQHNQLRSLAVELLKNQGFNYEEYNFLIKRFLTMIDKDGSGESKAIRDAYPMIIEYEKNKGIVEKINEINDKKILEELKQTLETKDEPLRQTSMFDLDYKGK